LQLLNDLLPIANANGISTFEKDLILAS